MADDKKDRQMLQQLEGGNQAGIEDPEIKEMLEDGRSGDAIRMLRARLGEADETGNQVNPRQGISTPAAAAEYQKQGLRPEASQAALQPAPESSKTLSDAELQQAEAEQSDLESVNDEDIQEIEQVDLADAGAALAGQPKLPATQPITKSTTGEGTEREPQPGGAKAKPQDTADAVARTTSAAGEGSPTQATKEETQTKQAEGKSASPGKK